MAKKQKRHRPQKGKPASRRRRSTSFISRLREHLRSLLIAAVAILILITAAVWFLTRTADIDALIAEGRAKLMLGSLAEAEALYHKALNEHPNDPVARREILLARLRAGVIRGNPADRALAVAEQAVAAEPEAAFPYVLTAQIHETTGDLHHAAAFARQALALCAEQPDAVAEYAASSILAGFYRDQEHFDSALTVSRRSLQLAESIEDNFHLAMASVAVGIAALRVDSLELARQLLAPLRDYEGVSKTEFRAVGWLALADAYQRAGSFDSARVSLEAASQLGLDRVSAGLAAYAALIRGRVWRDTGEYDQAITEFNASLATSHQLGNRGDIIDVLNDLARCYQLKGDLFNARKYYMAAGNLAKTSNLPGKDLYTADLNLRFHQALTQQQFQLAGSEGLELARFYSGS